MNEQQRSDLEDLREHHKTRLHLLEKKRAIFGISTPPEVDIEITIIEGEIEAIDLKLSIRNYTVTNCITIMISTAQPFDTIPLKLAKEYRKIGEVVHSSRLRDHIDLFLCTAVDPFSLQREVLTREPNIVQFSGHGTEHGALCFENERGELWPVTPEELGGLFSGFTDQVNCVLLNACFSECQAKAISKHIDYVIGIEGEIEDEAAIAFVTSFYQALGHGRNISESFNLGCSQFQFYKADDDSFPVLIERCQ